MFWLVSAKQNVETKPEKVHIPSQSAQLQCVAAKHNANSIGKNINKSAEQNLKVKERMYSSADPSVSTWLVCIHLQTLAFPHILARRQCRTESKPEKVHVPYIYIYIYEICTNAVCIMLCPLHTVV